MYKIEEVKKLNNEHIEKWRFLWESVPDSHFFNSPEWFVSYLDASPSEKVHIFFCYEKNELVGVLPFVETKKFGIRTLAHISGKFEFLDRSSLLFKKNDLCLFKEIFRQIGKDHNVFLAEVEEKSADLLKKTKQRVLSEFSTYCPRMNISEDDVLQNLSRKQKGTLKSRRRKNEEHLSFEFHRDDLERHLETMIRIEKKSHKKKRNIGLFDGEENIKLYRSLIKNASDKIGIAFLSFDGKPIAHRFGFFVRDTFLSVHIAFDDEYGRIGPGKMLLFYCLEYFQKTGVKVLDFSVGNSYLKEQFADDQIAQYNFYYSKNRAVMLWWKMILFMKEQAKQLKKLVEKNQKK